MPRRKRGLQSISQFLSWVRMKFWAGPRDYVRCYFPLWEEPSAPGPKIRPALVLNVIHTDEERLLLVMAQTTHPSQGRESYIDVESAIRGLREPGYGTHRYLELKKFMVLNGDDRSFFPDGGRSIGVLLPNKFAEVASTVTQQKLKPRMRAVMDIAPLGLRERCMACPPFVPSTRAPSAAQHQPHQT